MGITKVCAVRGLKIMIDVDSEVESGEVRNYEMWRVGHYDHKEPDTLDWIDTHFKPGDTVYDIGANIGQYALYAAKRLNNDVVILAFEPEALNFAKLNRNIVLNGLIDVIVPYPIATCTVISPNEFEQDLNGGFVLSNEAEVNFSDGVVQNLIFARP
jgi:ribosomal protein L11 methylase PrmA